MRNADHDRSELLTSVRVKVCFPLSDEDRGHGVEAENIWAECLGPNSYRVDNIPFYVYGISFDDVVRAGERDGRLVFEAVLSHGGHSTFRVLIKDEAGYESPAFNSRRRSLEQLGCSFEVAKRRWISIDVPPNCDVFAVYRVLEQGEEQDVWTFEEAHCGHEV